MRNRLNDVFTNALTGDGIFEYLDAFDVPWKSEVDAQSLDLDYHGNISGDKLTSPLVEKIKTGETLTNAERTTLAQTIWMIYGVNWTREYNILALEYEPIENYNMREEMTNDETVTEYGKESTRSGSETDTPNLTNTSSGDVYAFNSPDPVPTEKQSTTATGTATHTFNAVKDAESGSDTHTRNYLLTRSGNVGVTTSQQMIESEIALWRWNYFHDVVFPDIDRILTLKIY